MFPDDHPEARRGPRRVGRSANEKGILFVVAVLQCTKDISPQEEERIPIILNHLSYQHSELRAENSEIVARSSALEAEALPAVLLDNPSNS